MKSTLNSFSGISKTAFVTATALFLSFSVQAANLEQGETGMPMGTSFSVAEDAESKTFSIITNDRSEIGFVTLTEAAGGVLVYVNVEGISPGKHGVHFHQVADCSDDKFLNTKSHINNLGKEHGLKNPEGPDNADMHNLVANEMGVVSQILSTPRVSFYGTSDASPSLFDEDGSGFVIHANEDDQITQPIGGAGSRIGCAELK